MSNSTIEHSLKNGSLLLNLGLISVKVATTIPLVVEGLSSLYKDYAFSNAVGQWYDFSLGINRPNTLRAIIKPQVTFDFDGYKPFKPLPFAHSYPLFEWGLNWTVANHLHDYLILHAAVLEKGGKALVLPAPPGSGKSTLCAMLALNGWRLLSDEMAVINISTGNVIPFVRPICLKNNSIPLIKNLFPNAYVSNTAVDTQKGNVAHVRPPKEAVENKDKEALIAAFVFPKYIAKSRAILEPVSQTKTLESLIENAFNFDLFGHEGFKLLAGIVARATSYYCEYSDFEELEPKLSEMVR